MAVNLPKALPKPPGWVADFQAFLMRGNVIDLAVGIIIGAAFTGIVQSLVKDVLNPVIGLLTGGVDFSELFFTIKGPAESSLEAAKKAGAVTINYGLFLNAVFQFLIVGFVVFWLVQRRQRPPPTRLARRQAKNCSWKSATCSLSRSPSPPA
jgi:large conductance mechanosensitive channel